MRDIQYQNARGGNGQIININDIDPNDRRKHGGFSCLGCDGQLIPKLGKKVTWHYAHKSLVECSPETQLHKLAKALFAATYTSCLESGTPFNIVYEADVVCFYSLRLGKAQCRRKETRTKDLTQLYPVLKVEGRIAPFVADVLLSSEDGSQNLLVEFAVSHKCEPEKIASKHRILEITLTSEQEAIQLTNPRIDSKDEHVKLHNFTTKPGIYDYCRELCDKWIDLFLVEGDGTAKLHLVRAPKASRTVRENKAAYIGVGLHDHEYYADSTTNYNRYVLRAYGKGAPIKDCHLCRHHTPHRADSIVCSVLDKQKVAPSTAVNCKSYAPNITRKKALEKSEEHEPLF